MTTNAFLPPSFKAYLAKADNLSATFQPRKGKNHG